MRLVGNRDMLWKMMIDLAVPYSRKDEAKLDGARWNPDRKTWQAEGGPAAAQHWEPVDRVARYEDRHIMKTLGRWVPERKCWVVPRCLLAEVPA